MKVLLVISFQHKMLFDGFIFLPHFGVRFMVVKGHCKFKMFELININANSANSLSRRYRNGKIIDFKVTEGNEMFSNLKMFDRIHQKLKIKPFCLMTISVQVILSIPLAVCVE